jgi:hypothetical protein
MGLVGLVGEMERVWWPFRVEDACGMLIETVSNIGSLQMGNVTHFCGLGMAVPTVF